MPLIPVKLPPGLYKNGTPYSRAGRYADGNLVRHHDGSYRPIGGWVRRAVVSSNSPVDSIVDTPADEAVRDIFTWRGPGQTVNAVFCSNLGIYHLDTEGTITDITPMGYSAVNDSKNAIAVSGYGLQGYGLGAYGSGVTLSGYNIVPPDRWYTGNFGTVLLFGSISNGDMYELDLSDLSVSAVTNAPSDNQDICVTQERQVFAIGTDNEPRRVRSSDIEDRTDWTPTISNQSIDRVISGSGKLLRCEQVLQQILILGETDAHAARYIGPPYVYSIDLVGDNCGPLCPQALITTESFAVWWGARNFWLFNGNVEVLDCDVIDFLYDDINIDQASKICSFSNRDFSEVWWLYQSLGSTTGEVDSYVTWNFVRNTWSTGRIDRTAGMDKGEFTSVVMINSDGQIFNHEQANVFPSGEGNVFVETGPLDINNGEQNLAVRYLYPDVDALTGVSYTLYGRQFPTDTEYAYGPYTAANPTDTRAIGRSLRMRVNFASLGGEHGVVRIDAVPVGTGRR